MAKPKLPVVRTRAVFHIGTMERADKASRFTDSLEGHCLSVSHCPTAWRKIARLGGTPLWGLNNPEAVFLDIHKMSNSKALRKEIESWGYAERLVEKQTLWRAWSLDGEDDEWRYMLCASEREANDEVGDREQTEGPDGKPPVEAVEVLVGTPLLSARLGLKNLADRDSFDFLAMVWAEDTQPQVDGVWWRETYAPESLSAPRGGIFPSRLARWSHVSVKFEDYWDDETEENLKCGFLAVETAAAPRPGSARP